MDEPKLLIREWKRKQVLPALEHLYDEIWVYGLETFADPLAGVACPVAVREKILYTGYLRRAVPQFTEAMSIPVGDQPYVLVTVGGGDDGMSVVDWVLRAYERDPDIPLGAVLVLGPFMPPAMQRKFRDRAKLLPRLAVVTFDAHVERLMERAVGVVAMAGYNTFCEILSLDKRAILIPRTKPREEQLLRALRAAELGLVRTLDPRGVHDPRVMAAALRGLAQQPLPSVARCATDAGRHRRHHRSRGDARRESRPREEEGRGDLEIGSETTFVSGLTAIGVKDDFCVRLTAIGVRDDICVRLSRAVGRRRKVVSDPDFSKSRLDPTFLGR
jgi:predicted glycosyltransferase